MKGFPNQVAELGKLAQGMACMADLADAGADAKDDGVFGEALVRARVAGAGHTPRPIEEYLEEQRTKSRSNQSFRTTARGLRELYRLMSLIDDSGSDVSITQLGRQIADGAGKALDPPQIDLWRRVILNITHEDKNGLSHPYQVLLSLVARKPRITRAKCALALEARDDSPAELDRIAALADLPEDKILARIGVSSANFNNAKKLLPKFAEQLGDVIRTGQSFVLAVAPGRAREGAADIGRTAAPLRSLRPRAPRSSREVTPDSIGRAGTVERSDEVEVPPPEIDSAAAAAAVRTRANRLRRHNLLVKEFAARLAEAGARLYEDPFDILALFSSDGILVEVKTLDGSPDDERDRVRDALGQLLYYEVFVARPVAGEAVIRKIACFEHRLSDAHSQWLNGQGIGVIWKANDDIVGDALARGFLRTHLKEFR
jgi:hypothetical protein